MGLVEPAKAGVGVGLHQSGIARQMLLRMRTATIGRVEEHGRRRIWASKRTVVAHVGPEPAGPSLALGQDRHRGVIRVDALGCEDMAPDRIYQRHQGRRRGAHPVRKRRDVEIDAFTLVDVALPIERQVQAVLGKQNMGQQLGPCTPTRNRMRGGRRGWVIASQARQTSFSRTCWITFHWRGTSSSVSVTSSPILRNRLSPQHGQVAGTG